MIHLRGSRYTPRALPGRRETSLTPGISLRGHGS